MYEIKKIDLTSLVRFSAIIAGIVSLFPFIISLVFFLLFSIGSGLNYTGLFPLLLFLVVPLVGILAGALFGLIFGLLYNWLAPIVGGVKMELIFHPGEGQEVK